MENWYFTKDLAFNGFTNCVFLQNSWSSSANAKAEHQNSTKSNFRGHLVAVLKFDMIHTIVKKYSIYCRVKQNFDFIQVNGKIIFRLIPAWFSTLVEVFGMTSNCLKFMNMYQKTTIIATIIYSLATYPFDTSKPILFIEIYY